MSTIERPLPTFRIGKSNIIPVDPTTIDRLDPRGIIYLFEPPLARSKYIMGVDATQGRSNWSRFNRTEDDHSIDNGAIEILKVGRGEPGKEGYIPDIQVAEYAAPIDPYDLATVANALGRMYCGRNEDAQCPCIIEVYPGPGGPTQRTMMEKYGYTNMYQWQYLDTGDQSSKKMDFGWYSSKQSMQHLWTKGLRHLSKRQVVLKSPWLVEELADCEMDLVRLRGAASGSGHDDRVIALLLAVWYAHNWTFNIETDSKTRAQTGPAVEWQRAGVSSEKMQEEWDDRFEQISQEAEQDYGY